MRALGALVELMIRPKNCLSQSFSSEIHVSQIVRRRALVKHTSMVKTPVVVIVVEVSPQIILPVWGI